MFIYNHIVDATLSNGIEMDIEYLTIINMRKDKMEHS